MRNILILFLLTLNTIASAINYYVSNTGSDSNNGLTPESAWQTIIRVNSQKLEPGDSVLFKRGDVWVGQNLKIASSGIATHRITYSAYGEGERPIITGIDEVPDWDTELTWTDLGDNTWSMYMGGLAARRLWFNDEEVARSREDSLGTGSVSSDYPWQFHDGTLYVYSVGNPANYYSKMEITASERFLSPDPELKDYITFSNLDIRGWRYTRMYGCSYWIIEYCNWGWGNTEYGIIIRQHSDSGTPSEGGIIRNCIFDTGDRIPETYNPSDYAYSYNTHDGINMAGGCKNWQIYDNEFMAWGHTAVYLNSSSGILEGNKIYNNYFSQEWGDYGRALECGGVNLDDFNEDNPNVFYDNYIYMQSVPSQFGAPYTRVYNNIFDGVTGRENNPGQSSHALTIGAFGSRLPYKMKFYNNIFAHAGGNAIGFHMYDYYSNVADGTEFMNNIFYENGRYFRSESDSDRIKNSVFKNNLFYGDVNKNNTLRIYTASWQSLSVTEFNALPEDDESGNPQNWITENNIEADPLFVNPENGDFRLQEGSPAIGAGVAPLSGYDHDGVSWHDPPSIGPFTKEKLFSLNIEINDKGSAKVNGEKFTNPLSFKRETTLYIEAIPEPGWIFSHWEGATTSIVNPLKIIMNDDKFIEAVFLEEEVKYNIYPNPARDYFSIYFEGKSFEPGSFITPVERQSFRIIDLLGRIVYEDFLDPGITVVQIPGHISTGIYIIELLLGGLSVYVQRLIITK